MLVREISTGVQAAVAITNKGKPLIPDHKLLFVPCQTADEAHYLTAVLNSAIMNAYAKALMISTHYSTKMIALLRISVYDSGNKLHCDLARLSRRAHSVTNVATDSEPRESLESLEAEMDVAVAQLLGVSHQDLRFIKQWVRSS